MNKPVFYDSDCLVCFLIINQCDFLQELFSKVVVPLNVKEEIMNPCTPKIIKTNFSKLIKIGFVEIMEIDSESEEYAFYERIRNSNLKNNKPVIGDGEAAVITLSHMHNGVVASNNLSDVYDYVKEFNLNLITTAFILAMAYNEEVKTEKELNDIWIKMQNRGRKRSLPKSDSFTEYYSKIYPKDLKFMGIS